MAKTNTPTIADSFGDLKSMLEQFKLPGIDVHSIVDSRRKDVEALLAANKSAADAMQELAKKQGEVFATALQGLQSSAQSVGDPLKQSELARAAYEKAVAEMGALAKLAQKAQADAMATISQRAQQSVEEVKKVFQAR